VYVIFIFAHRFSVLIYLHFKHLMNGAADMLAVFIL